MSLVNPEPRSPTSRGGRLVRRGGHAPRKGREAVPASWGKWRPGLRGGPGGAPRADRPGLRRRPARSLWAGPVGPAVLRGLGFNALFSAASTLIKARQAA